ncbi:MAG: chemotaxis protein CheW [Gammaproteobacteria bacterium]|nr:chemotaxis protein CheW [Gammaproteobacteria bacterium]
MTAVEQFGNVSDSLAESGSEKYLSFVADRKNYGVAICRIKEIIEQCSVTRVPLSPDYIRGVINLRGRVVPVVDLSARLGGPVTQVGKRSCIVIVEVLAEEESVEIGFMVDGVTEVVSLNDDLVETAPSFGLNLRPDFVSGMGKTDSGVMVLLNVETVLSVNELADACEQHSTQIVRGAA